MTEALLEATDLHKSFGDGGWFTKQQPIHAVKIAHCLTLRTTRGINERLRFIYASSPYLGRGTYVHRYIPF